MKIWNDSKTKDKNQINRFLQLDSIALENFNEEYEQNSDQKLRKRKYIDLFIQKKSEVDNRLIDCKDNTPSHIILKTDDLITEKAKNQKYLDVGLSGLIGNKDNSDIASKISYQIFFYTNNSRKIFKKNNEKK